jgi:rubrerythrin
MEQTRPRQRYPFNASALPKVRGADVTTTVGTENTLESLLEDLIQVDYDAADAYQAAIDRLENSSYRAALAEFKRDHLRHITELGDILSSMGCTSPKEGDMKALLAKGKVVIAGLMGDESILQAMRTNKADTAYERAVSFKGLQANKRDVLQRGLEDERRHCEWILEQLKHD